jgi:uncharacterized protein YbjT (DUF2867 family)/predicted XRE-type DNA-binding protein
MRAVQIARRPKQLWVLHTLARWPRGPYPGFRIPTQRYHALATLKQPGRRLVRSTGNVFLDLGFSPDEAARLRIRSTLMIHFRALTDWDGWSQTETAKQLGVSQPRINDLVHGRIELFGIDSLLNLLIRAGADLRLTIRGSGLASLRIPLAYPPFWSYLPAQPTVRGENMPDRKIIAVVGATGPQGGSLVRAILADKNSPFIARALTRNPNSDKARALADAGAQVVEANIDDEASVQRAFAGAYGAFCVTNFWEHMSPERELKQARNLAEAARNAALKHVVWSTLEDTRDWVPLDDNRMPTLQGKYKVPHFDAKGEADDFFRQLGVPTTFLLTTFYWDNFVGLKMGPQPGPDGTLQITLPIGQSKLSGMAAEDIGKTAYGIFKRGEEMIGKTVAIAGDHLTGQQMADAFSRALGREVRYNPISPETYRSLGFPGADDLGNMFQFYTEFDDYFSGIRDLDAARKLNPELQSFDMWLERNAKRLANGS